MSKRDSIRRFSLWRRKWDKILILVILAGWLLFYPGQNVYTTARGTSRSVLRALPFPLPTPAPYPVNVRGVYPGEDITATGVVILDPDSGVFLYRRNADELFAPASTTKILSALVVLDAYSLDDVLTVSTLVSDGQVMGLVTGERMTVENLLYGMLVSSGNDAAWVLADNYPAGIGAFVAAMNDKAKQLHLTKSSFTNPVGYDDPGHKMTPTDLARLAAVALADKTVAKIVAIPQITVSDVTHSRFHSLKNINELLGKIPGVGGIKTGWTEEAGENLVTLIERDGRRVILVLLRSADRFSETEALIEWVYSNYRWEDMNRVP
jgi:D-alanyl-D-alanine carboxypeptidase